jgi:hypothetical protein
LHFNGFTKFGVPRRRYKNKSIINVNKENNARNNETMRDVPATMVAGEKQ